MKISKNIFYIISSLLLNSQSFNNPIDIIKKYNKIEKIECDDDEFEIIEIDLYEINKDIIKNNLENVLDYKITRLPKNKGWLINYKYFGKHWAYGKNNIPKFFDWEHKGCYLGRMFTDFIKPNQTIIFKNLCFNKNKSETIKNYKQNISKRNLKSQNEKETINFFKKIGINLIDDNNYDYIYDEYVSSTINYNLLQPDFLLMQIFYFVFKVSFKEMFLKYLNLDWYLACYGYGFGFSLRLKSSGIYNKNSKDIFGANIIWDKEYDKLDPNIKSKYSKEIFFEKNNHNEKITKINNELIKKVINSKELKEKILFFIEEAFNKQKLIQICDKKYKEFFRLNELERNAIKYFVGWYTMLENNLFFDIKTIDLFQKKEIYKKIIKTKIIKGKYEFTFPTDNEKNKFIK